MTSPACGLSDSHNNTLFTQIIFSPTGALYALITFSHKSTQCTVKFDEVQGLGRVPSSLSTGALIAPLTSLELPSGQMLM